MVYIRNIKIYMFSLLLPALIFPRSIRPPHTHGTGESMQAPHPRLPAPPTARQKGDTLRTGSLDHGGFDEMVKNENG